MNKLSSVAQHDGVQWKIRPLSNGLTYVQQVLRNTRLYCEYIAILKLYTGEAIVRYYLSDGRIVTQPWADHTVALDYFRRRSRVFRGVRIEFSSY